MTLLKLIFILNIILILYIIYSGYNQKELFTVNTSQNNIWMYWENKPNKTKPIYLEICYETIKKHCKGSFHIYLLNEKTISNYLPNIRKDLDDKLSIPQKTDYYRYYLLQKYGGIWLDADTIVFKDLIPILNKLKKYDFVGFGCHYSDSKCQKNTDGYPYPTNWVMASQKNSELMRLCCRDCDILLDKDTGLLKKQYFKIGRNLMWKKIDYLLKNDPLWKYYHYDSKCIERDSDGVKLKNFRMLSNENIDQKCKPNFLFIPIYNTAPGFPNWFLTLDKKQLLQSNMLISKLFRYSLNIK